MSSIGGEVYVYLLPLHDVVGDKVVFQRPAIDVEQGGCLPCSKVGNVNRPWRPAQVFGLEVSVEFQTLPLFDVENGRGKRCGAVSGCVGNGDRFLVAVSDLTELHIVYVPLAGYRPVGEVLAGLEILGVVCRHRLVGSEVGLERHADGEVGFYHGTLGASAARHHVELA